MFRNPRENGSSTATTPAKPAVGRPPTPPSTRSSRRSSTKTVNAEFFAPRSSIKQPVPAVGGKLSGKSKTPIKGNKSILNFFKKVDPASQDGTDGALFLVDNDQILGAEDEENQAPNIDAFDNTGELFDEAIDDARYNELGGSLKRRKLSIDDEYEVDRTRDGKEESTTNPVAAEQSSLNVPNVLHPTVKSKKRKPRRTGPFLEDSDSEDNDDDLADDKRSEAAELGEAGQDVDSDFKQSEMLPPDSDTDKGQKSTPNSPYPALLMRNDTSYSDLGYSDGMTGFTENDFEDGDDLAELQWLEQQEMEEAMNLSNEGVNNEIDEGVAEGPDEGISPRCPICDGSLAGFDENEASRHVNACLDGDPIPLPAEHRSESPEPKESSEPKMMPPGAKSRFARAAIARPGQSNPINLGDSDTGKSSAFSKLMSGHAEDAAWATAAAAENASRGKPAYQRTCPFYKIMPGFYICVDAFRYGAVQGCNAYFLSHFHSDHYIGLTSNWCHGPIYCSTITANLVKLQLRVDPKWVVPLDFDSGFEIPNTKGVSVTMIPANHCPGSSLFLFEKSFGKGTTQRMQRVLHCGDFRACQAHVVHPLLMPDVRDKVSGKSRQQKIDVCYLDTTYLNPKYAFPRQEEVINACADMCASLNKMKVDSDDAWERMLRDRAGSGMTKFVKSEKQGSSSDGDGQAEGRGRLLVICGTYSIGKERMCLGIARALNSKIWAPPAKRRICAALEDPELMERMTDDPREAQVHMQMLMELRAETLQEYLNPFKPHFSRIVGFRPTGWNYRPPKSRFVESPSVRVVLSGSNWQSAYTMADIVPQRGSNREAACFGVPYSEHSSFRELTLFCCALRIERIIPTVNVGSATSRARMKFWCDRWLAERRKNGVIKLGDGSDSIKW